MCSSDSPNLGVFAILGSLHDGLQKAPRIWGSEVRATRKINNFSDGLKAGARGYWYGWYDGLKGVVMSPVKGAKEDVRDAVCPRSRRMH